jgi:hypothetical protein
MFDDLKAGARLRGLEPAGVAEIVQVAHFGSDALNLVFRVNGRVGEWLVYRGEETTFEFLEAVRHHTMTSVEALMSLTPGRRIEKTPISVGAQRRGR